MRFARVLALIAIAALLASGALIDRQERPAHPRPMRLDSAVAVSVGSSTTWFCPGGSGSGGSAELTLELLSASRRVRSAIVSVLPGSPGPDEAGVVRVEIQPGERETVEPSRHAPEARWVGAVVEVDGSDVVVEQVVAADQGGVGRSPCLTATADRWVSSNGGTRLAVQKERFVLMLLNPFPDFAVAEVDLVADVGRDTVEGVVVPAGRVVALDVTEEITEAETVTALVDVQSGRLAVSSIQLSDGPDAGRGARVAPAAPGAAPLWYLPVASARQGVRRDVVAVSNPSSEETAEVDLEFVADDPSLSVNPIEVTVLPERTALVDLSQQDRLGGGEFYTVVVRSLYGVPVTASITSVSHASASASADPDAAPDADAGAAGAGADAAGAAAGTGAASGMVEGTTAMVAADVAARRWLAPVEGADIEAAPGYDSSAVVVFNPSSAGIALVDLKVDGETIQSLELGPRRRRRLPVAWLGSGRFVLEFEASAPVVVARELVGLTSRTSALGVAASQPVPAATVR